MLLHQKILYARKSAGLTQEELAVKANVTVRTIQRIESGETIPRDFTLKSLSAALNIPFSELIRNDGIPKTLSEDQKYFLNMVNLSCFAYIVLPFIHFLIPANMLKKGSRFDASTIIEGRKLVRLQINWVIALNLLMLLTVAYNLLLARPAQLPVVHYLWPCLIMYFLNAIVIISNSFRIKKMS